MADGPAHAALRVATRDDHECVDAAFEQFDLASRPSYAAFLRAHARVLPALERDLVPGELLPEWTGRSAALADDLRALGSDQPVADSPAINAGDGARWGALYVIEGSRLGGALLARRVGDKFPAAYLRSTHGPGNWRSFLAAMECALTSQQDLDDAITSAKGVFVAYRNAAERERDFG